MIPQLPVAITCGEPAGVGPEIAAKAWQALRAEVPMVFLGDPSHLPADIPHEVIDTPSRAPDVTQRALPVLARDFGGPAQPGVATPHHAQHVIDVIAEAVALVEQGAACAVCTAPIHKKALMDGAGFSYPGHTEYLEALTQAPRAVMMLASDQLRVVPATIHIALDDVPAALTPDLLRDTIRITAQGLRDQFHIPAPHIAVAGLNPHAG